MILPRCQMRRTGSFVTGGFCFFRLPIFQRWAMRIQPKPVRDRKSEHRHPIRPEGKLLVTQGSCMGPEARAHHDRRLNELAQRAAAGKEVQPVGDCYDFEGVGTSTDSGRPNPNSFPLTHEGSGETNDGQANNGPPGDQGSSGLSSSLIGDLDDLDDLDFYDDLDSGD